VVVLRIEECLESKPISLATGHGMTNSVPKVANVVRAPNIFKRKPILQVPVSSDKGIMGCAALYYGGESTTSTQDDKRATEYGVSTRNRRGGLCSQFV
jgi:hypothetical protein